MTRIVGVAGSLRKGSLNASLLRAAADLAPAGTHVEIGDIGEIPLYNGDVEAEFGLPAAVTTLKDQLAAADGILIVTPEYNGSMPGVLKNATDWLSRPTEDIARVFGDKPVALMGATMGGLGTIRAQQAWLPILKAFRMRPWFAQDMLVSRAHQLFDEDGQLTDEPTRAKLERFMQAFVEFIG
ncbi:MAG: NAD(P)H-dependent oxidoreductase [Gammaproteobacteria bacterium]|nr:NAD(P)H-dependent oxidoreductase [Gammaproteobacteria bacterium]NND35525.1 NAD(P)H-dependent oxidoreductase [Gammaproteobacteria bacterium]